MAEYTGPQSLATCAGKLMDIAQAKASASQIAVGGDKFAANAKSPKWAAGFDQKLKSKRTT